MAGRRVAPCRQRARRRAQIVGLERRWPRPDARYRAAQRFYRSSVRRDEHAFRHRPHRLACLHLLALGVRHFRARSPAPGARSTGKDPDRSRQGQTMDDDAGAQERRRARRDFPSAHRQAPLQRQERWTASLRTASQPPGHGRSARPHDRDGQPADHASARRRHHHETLRRAIVILDQDALEACTGEC